MISAFDPTCPRCHGKGLAPPSTAPIGAAPAATPAPMMPAGTTANADAPSFGLAALGFLMPFFLYFPGLILGGIFYFFIRDSQPAKARSFGKGMLWSLAVIRTVLNTPPLAAWDERAVG